MPLVKLKNSKGELLGVINEDTGEEQLSEQLKPKRKPKVKDERNREDTDDRADSTDNS